MKRLFFVLCLSLLLCACSSAPAADPSIEAADIQWTPPLLLSDEANSILEALAFCKAFSEEMSRVYPDYAPALSEQDVSYFENRCADPDTDLNDLSAELALTIIAFRQQIYLRMEETTKLHKPLPDGLERFVRNFEEDLHEIGW